MQVKRRYSLIEIIQWTSRDIFLFSVLGTVVVVLYEVLDLKFLTLPWLPLSLIGIAVAFFLGFKTNSSYDRQWEARKIYGAIVNSSRSWAMMIIGFVTEQFRDIEISKEELKLIHKEMILRHVAWLTALRHQLRIGKSWEHLGERDNFYRKKLGSNEIKYSMDEELKPYLSEKELDYILSKKNKATNLLNRQSIRLKELRAQNLIDDFRHVELENMLVDFFTQQGKCERIKNYPFPRQYATVNYLYIWIFILLVPFGLVGIFDDFGQDFGEFGQYFVWLTIPFTILISWIFYTMERVGDYSENPFEGLHNDIPITALSRTIEIDLLQMLDLEKDEIPDPIGPTNNILL